MLCSFAGWPPVSCYSVGRGLDPAVQICVARYVPGNRNVPGRRTRRPYIYRKTGRLVVKTPRLPGRSCYIYRKTRRFVVKTPRLPERSCGGVKTPPYDLP